MKSKILLVLVLSLSLIIFLIFINSLLIKCYGIPHFVEIGDLNRSVNNLEEAYDAFDIYHILPSGNLSYYGITKEEIEFKKIILKNESEIYAWVIPLHYAIDDVGKIYVEEYCA